MQGVLHFGSGGESDRPAQKKRKAIRACQRCKETKKRCNLTADSLKCRKCGEDGWVCSFETEPSSGAAVSRSFAPRAGDHTSQLTTSNEPASLRQNREVNSSASRPGHTIRASVSSVSPSQSWAWPGDRSQGEDRPPLSVPTGLTNDSGEHASLLSNPPAMSPVAKEYRYATMLSLMESGSSNHNTGTESPRRATKLITGTNPLSALLRKDLKHKIVTNSCSFRTPDLESNSTPSSIRLGFGVHNCDWEQRYRTLAVSNARLQYLRSVGCFNLPSPSQASELLEVFFAYIHPMLPVIDRRSFLSGYYGSDSPPSLLLMQSVFLAASRYMGGNRGGDDEVSEVRQHCDELHTKVMALIDVEMRVDRLCVVQATLIASLHWEGREGLNSATDSLSLAVRVCQEMGIHRKLPVPQQRKGQEGGQHDALQRRLWWHTYVLDRFTAAQEGTPFLINENDCNVDPLTEEDLKGEDLLTTRATFINQSLAGIIEDTVRNLYSPDAEDGRLYTAESLEIRQRLLQRLDVVASHTQGTLLANKDLDTLLNESPSDITTLHGAIVLTHLDAVRILVHRPFILLNEAVGPGLCSSRDSCRVISINIVQRLKSLKSYGLLRFSWPFTVYAVVNCLLIFWYDVSSPPSANVSDPQEARELYASVVNILEVMGDTWWAAAAKHKLALALARVISMVQTDDAQRHGPSQLAVPDEAISKPLTPPPLINDTASLPMDIWEWPDTTGALGGLPDEDFWASIGLDFNTDVADNIYSIG